MSDEPAAAPAGEEPAAEAAAAAPAEPAAPDAAAETPAAAAAETGAEPAEAGAFGSTGPAEPAAAEAKQGDKPEGGKGGKSGKSASKSPTKARLAYYSSSCVAHNSLHWRRTRHRPFAVAAATARNVACSYTHPHVHSVTHALHTQERKPPPAEAPAVPAKPPPEPKPPLPRASTVKVPSLAVPQLGSCASSGRAWRLWAALGSSALPGRGPSS